ncbi:hypothetical protein [Mycobacterium sp. UM_Kg1]|uniref:AMP-binding enzyme n=1 Tax=Mycobacterium sp. UM_Kg1 TaxID=1545691 RepID=UPI00256FC71E|nr:hypothetical protein [Mycobacterium sp. UM_Kg1]
MIGAPDDIYGEGRIAVVVMRSGAPALPAERLGAFCTGRLAHFKVPRCVRVVTEFPMTGRRNGPHGRDGPAGGRTWPWADRGVQRMVFSGIS